MAELIKINNASYDRYEELLLKRDRLEREAGSILTAYTKEFGELLTAVFEEKIECIKQKKAIAFCQAAINRSETIRPEEMQKYLDKNMAMYYQELKGMLQQNEEARTARTASFADVERSKKLYRKIAKMIHPDINPQTSEISQLSDLWNRVVIAYHTNNPIELSELEVLVNKAVTDFGLGVMDIEIPDIDIRIQNLEEEINTILTTEPYTYGDLLSDPEKVQNKKDELDEELNTYKKYHEELNKVLSALIMEGGLSVEWTMD